MPAVSPLPRAERPSRPKAEPGPSSSASSDRESSQSLTAAVRAPVRPARVAAASDRTCEITSAPTGSR